MTRWMKSSAIFRAWTVPLLRKRPILKRTKKRTERHKSKTASLNEKCIAKVEELLNVTNLYDGTVVSLGIGAASVAEIGTDLDASTFRADVSRGK